jgi:hypothetical protein
MSLDLWLEVDTPNLIVEPHDAIFIRRDGETVEISRSEWDRLHPGAEPVSIARNPTKVYSANITHNLAKMAREADLYFLWHPEDHAINIASDMTSRLKAGIDKLKNNPEHMKKFNPSNEWGSYEGLLRFAEGVLDACEMNPTAKVRAWA